MRRDLACRYVRACLQRSSAVLGLILLPDPRVVSTTRTRNARRTIQQTRFYKYSLSYGVILLPGLLAGCSRAPSFDIVGSFFPAWLVCLFLGILLAAFTRWLLLRLKVALALPILVYPSLAGLFTFLLWLVFFS